MQEVQACVCMNRPSHPPGPSRAALSLGASSAAVGKRVSFHFRAQLAPHQLQGEGSAAGQRCSRDGGRGTRRQGSQTGQLQGDFRVALHPPSCRQGLQEGSEARRQDAARGASTAVCRVHAAWGLGVPGSGAEVVCSLPGPAGKGEHSRQSRLGSSQAGRGCKPGLPHLPHLQQFAGHAHTCPTCTCPNPSDAVMAWHAQLLLSILAPVVLGITIPEVGTENRAELMSPTSG